MSPKWGCLVPAICCAVYFGWASLCLCCAHLVQQVDGLWPTDVETDLFSVTMQIEVIWQPLTSLQETSCARMCDLPYDWSRSRYCIDVISLGSVLAILCDVFTWLMTFPLSSHLPLALAQKYIASRLWICQAWIWVLNKLILVVVLYLDSDIRDKIWGALMMKL